MEEDIQSRSSDHPLLSAIVPLTRMAGRLDNLYSWIEHIDSFSIQVIIVHDVQDEETSAELIMMLNRIVTDKILLIEGNFHSPGIARNQGILKAEGDWIAFWDSDDIPNVSEFLRAISNTPQDVSSLVTGFQVVSYKTKQVLWQSTALNSENNSKLIAKFPGVWRMIFRKELIQGTSFRQFHMGEDQFYLIENDVINRKTAFHDGVTYSYFVDFPGQLTSQKMKIADLPQVISALIDLNKDEWGEIDLRLFARIVMTVITKGSFNSKVSVAKLLPKLIFTLGIKNSLLVLSFQFLQVISEFSSFAKVGSGKIIHVFKS